MAIKAGKSIEINDWTDPYIVEFDAYAHTFAAGVTAVTSAQSVTIKVTVRQNNNPVACNIGTITGAVSGLSTTSTGSGATAVVDPTVTVSAASGLSANGVLTIPVVIGTGESQVTISKKFSWALAKTGATGQQGIQGKPGNDGATGNGIASIVTTYQAASNGTTVPTGTWGNSVPALNPGQWLWTKRLTNFTNGTNTTDYSVAYMGTNGATGAPGTAGKGIKSTAVHYAVLASGTDSAGASWSSTIPEKQPGKYIWTRTTITYTDNATSTSYSIAYTPGDVYNLEIDSSAGFLFRNTGVNTTLSLRLSKGPVTITGDAIKQEGTIKWYKDGVEMKQHLNKPSISVTDADVVSKAIFTAEIVG